MTATQTGQTTHQPVTPAWGWWIFEGPEIWRLIAVIAMLGTAVGITSTDAINLCSSAGPLVLSLAWLVLPIITIASIATVAAVTPQTAERFIAATLALCLTAGWTYAIAWASVGQAIQGTMC